MKKVLVLGAGLVSRPLVHYLLDQEGFQVRVASRTVEKARELTTGKANGTAEQVDVSDEQALERLIAEADLSISLLPYVYHPVVARLCVKHKKHMVTTSYVKDAMLDLDGAAKSAGVILLNEIGVDPGIDHMSAMQVIDDVRARGGELLKFSSYCGGLPAPEANTNPFGYKFSWSPRGVLLAGKNPARYLEDGKAIDIKGEDLFAHHWPVRIEGFGMLEGYPNRDSLPYRGTYGIPGVRSMFRGTLRYPGWCDTLRGIVRLGFLDETKRTDLTGFDFAGLVKRLTKSPGKDLKREAASFLEIAPDSPITSKLEWLGLFSSDPLPVGASSYLDVLTERMLEKMQYAPGERDLLVMQHEFVARLGDRTEKITSTLVDYGIPHGDTSMSRLVGLPAAIAARLILVGKVDLVGVQVPVRPELYVPVLEELAKMGVKFREKSEVLPAK
jgi:saccharopine dehydrogenase-like NADP-dependent oxidoreductase